MTSAVCISDIFTSRFFCSVEVLTRERSPLMCERAPARGEGASYLCLGAHRTIKSGGLRRFGRRPINRLTRARAPVDRTPSRGAVFARLGAGGEREELPARPTAARGGSAPPGARRCAELERSVRRGS